MVEFENPFDDKPPPSPSKAVALAGRKRSNQPTAAKTKVGKCPQCEKSFSTEVEMNAHIADSHYQDVPGHRFEGPPDTRYQDVPGKKYEPVSTTEFGGCQLEHIDTAGIHEANKRANGYDIGRYRLLYHYHRWARNDDNLRVATAKDRRAAGSLVTLGIDASWTSPGIAFAESGQGGFLADVLAMVEGSEQEHVAGAANALRSALVDLWEPMPVLAVMERAFVPPNVARSGDSSRKLNLVQGAFLDVLWEAHIPCVILSPTTIKKFATGSGNASKPEVLQAAVDQLGLERSGPLKKDEKTDYDRADALWMAVIGALLVPEFDFDGTGWFFEEEQLEYLNTVNVEDLETEDDE